jgi:hypothetical protein
VLPVDADRFGNTKLFKSIAKDVVFTITGFEFEDFSLNPMLTEIPRNCFGAVSAFEDVKLTSDCLNFLKDVRIIPIIRRLVDEMTSWRSPSNPHYIFGGCYYRRLVMKNGIHIIA